MTPPEGRSVGVGAVLIAPGTLLPTEWRLADNSMMSGWSRLANTFESKQLERELGTAGWTFFFMASPVTTVSFGLSRENMLGAAVGRLIASATLQKCNCLEIDEVGMRSFLGIPYMSISAHPRHIQKGMVFSGH